MKKGTFRFIIVLVALLFLNIEAAQAGIVQRIRFYIHSEFPDHQFTYLMIIAVFISLVAYIIIAPVPIGKEKWSKLDYYRIQPRRHTYKARRISVNRIADLLKSTESANSAHS
jgi:hypothetical protein